MRIFVGGKKDKNKFFAIPLPSPSKNSNYEKYLLNANWNLDI